MGNHIFRYTASRILIGIIAITILSGYAFESTVSKYGSYLPAAERDGRVPSELYDEISVIYGTDNALTERLYFWIDIITSSIPFSLIDYFSIGIPSDVLQTRSEFGISFHYHMHVMLIMNERGPNTVFLIASALTLVLLISIAWFYISKLLNRGTEDSKEDLKQIEKRAPRKDHISMGIIIFIPLVWSLIADNYLYDFLMDFIFLGGLKLPIILNNRGLAKIFDPLINTDLLGLDITIMGLDWLHDRLVHLIYPSIILLFGLIPLVLIFNRAPRITDNELPDTSFHLDIASRNFHLRIPVIFFIGFILFVVFSNNMVEVFFNWPGISRLLLYTGLEADWAMILACKITLYRIIVWFTVIIDISFYLFSNYRIKKQSLVNKQEFKARILELLSAIKIRRQKNKGKIIKNN